MLIDQLKVGTKIGIFVNRTTDIIDYAYELKSQIADVISQNEFVILSPMFKGKSVSLAVGDKLLITVAYGEDGLSIFEAESRELIVDANGVLFYRIIGIAEAGKLQRREHYRMQLQIPIVYQVKKDNKNVYGQGITCDISGGGVRFICGDQLEKGDCLSIFIRIEPDIDLRTQVEVIRVQLEGYKKYEVSTLFSLEFKEKEKVIKHIFSIQKEKLRKYKDLKKS